MSRDVFGCIFKTLCKYNEKNTRNIFELYDKCNFENISFFTFYAALLVFNELGFIKLTENDILRFKINKEKKSELSQSKIYNEILKLKESLHGEVNNERNEPQSKK